jgi:hypothetical protein
MLLSLTLKFSACPKLKLRFCASGTACPIVLNLISETLDSEDWVKISFARSTIQTLVTPGVGLHVINEKLSGWTHEPARAAVAFLASPQ